MRFLGLPALLLLLSISVQAQVRSLPATRVAAPLRIDGQLDEAAWAEAPSANNFIQNYPVAGQPATIRTEVKILYDNNAIYIGAYLYDDPKLIRRQLTARDGEDRQDVDYFSIFFDTYNDKQNGFQFLVTSTNVQTDAKLTGSGNARFGNFGDKSWDAVWQSRTSYKEDGWVAEIRIPYISLRFARHEVQDWGLQLLRFTRRNNETSFFQPVDPGVNGFVNQFGQLTGLANIEPPLRLSFSPYVSSGVRYEPGAGEGELLRSGGMDLKYGINESFTLDATLIPDFGQVVSDNLINNLSPFEVQFQENRPFFTEGTELFNKSGLFYSRRVGATPGGYGAVRSFLDGNPAYGVRRNPSITQLYNALKLSGRTENKLGIGVFNAVTAPMRATLVTPEGRDTSIRTEPLTNYNIVVLDQAFRGQSSVTFTNTNVWRSGNARDANVSALDWALFNKGNTHALQGTARYSTVQGFTPYNGSINLVRDTVRVGGALVVQPYDGFNAELGYGKVSGQWQYRFGAGMESNDYDPNDLGFLRTPNSVVYEAEVEYNQFNPKGAFLNYNYSLGVEYNYLYQPYRFTGVELRATGFWIFKNFWDVRVLGIVQPYWQNDYFELRTPGRFVKKPWYFFMDVSGSTDSRKRLYASYELGFAEGALPNNPYFLTDFGLRYRFSDRFTLSLDMSRQEDKSQVGYAFRREANGEPIVGFRRWREMSGILSGRYNFTPRMNLTFRARHYWNALNYQSFYNVKSDGFYTERPFIAGQDENFNVFNLDAFYTWDFRPGSRIVAGWKNWLGGNEYIDPLMYQGFVSNFRKTLTQAHGNELTLRVIYFLDYNQMRRKK